MDDNLVNIANLLKRENQLKEDLSKVRNAIGSIRSLCTHNYKSDNYTDGGGKRYKTCEICGDSDWD